MLAQHLCSLPNYFCCSNIDFPFLCWLFTCQSFYNLVIALLMACNQQRAFILFFFLLCSWHNNKYLNSKNIYKAKENEGKKKTLVLIIQGVGINSRVFSLLLSCMQCQNLLDPASGRLQRILTYKKLVTKAFLSQQNTNQWSIFRTQWF